MLNLTPLSFVMSILKPMTLCSLFTSLLLIPSFAQHFLGTFSGLVLQVDTQLESPVQNNNVQTLPEQETGDTIRFQLFVPAGAGHSTNGYTVELDLPGKTFSSYIGNVSGKDWTGGALIGTGSTKSALFTTGVSVPSTGYLGQLDLQVMRPLKDGATLIVKSLSITSGSNVDVLDVSNAIISFTVLTTGPGDFDGSGDVNLADFLLFAAVFNKSSSDVEFDARMDFDGNGNVNLADFLVFAEVFGTTYSTGGGQGGGGQEGIGPNQAPRAVENIADQDMIQGEGDAVLDVSPYFRDGDRDELTFAAVSSDESVATVVISGSTATIKPVSPGSAAVTVTAMDPGGLSATQRFRVYVEAPGPPLTGPYEPLEWISVSPGRIVWRPVSFIPFRCLGWSVATVNGVTYEIHFSQWQRRDNSRSPWTDIPGTRKARKMCGYTPDTSGEYRLVMELSINGIRGRYASSNTITAICDGGECRFFQL